MPKNKHSKGQSTLGRTAARLRKELAGKDVGSMSHTSLMAAVARASGERNMMTALAHEGPPEAPQVPAWRLGARVDGGCASADAEEQAEFDARWYLATVSRVGLMDLVRSDFGSGYGDEEMARAIANRDRKAEADALPAGSPMTAENLREILAHERESAAVQAVLEHNQESGDGCDDLQCDVDAGQALDWLWDHRRAEFVDAAFEATEEGRVDDAISQHPDLLEAVRALRQAKLAGLGQEVTATVAAADGWTAEFDARPALARAGMEEICSLLTAAGETCDGSREAARRAGRSHPEIGRLLAYAEKAGNGGFSCEIDADAMNEWLSEHRRDVARRAAWVPGRDGGKN